MNGFGWIVLGSMLLAAALVLLTVTQLLLARWLRRFKQE